MYISKCVSNSRHAGVHAYKSVRTCACVCMGVCVCFCVGETWQRGGTCFRCLIIMSWPGTHGQSLQSFSGISPSQSTGSSQLPQRLTIRALTRPKAGTMLMATGQQNSQLVTPGPSRMIYLWKGVRTCVSSVSVL